MYGSFGVVLWIVCGLGILAALYGLTGSAKHWDAYTKRGLFMESAQPDRPTPVSVNSREAERVDEIRQLVEAANHRRARRGEAVLDVEAEVSRLTAEAAADPSAAGAEVDPEIVEEVRTLIELRNQRRLRRGESPLDVESELRRQLDGLGPLARGGG